MAILLVGLPLILESHVGTRGHQFNARGLPAEDRGVKPT
jgi:hypothetical protein